MCGKSGKQQSFYLLKDTLANLENFSSYDSILDEFEERLLAVLGFAPNFTQLKTGRVL